MDLFPFSCSKKKNIFTIFHLIRKLRNNNNIMNKHFTFNILKEKTKPIKK